MKNSRNYLLLAGILGIVACEPVNELPEMQSYDAAGDSQQISDSRMVTEDADSSIIEEDSSVVETDVSDASALSDSSDAGSDSRATDAARESNVLYRTSDGGFEGVIEFNAMEIVQDGGVNRTIQEIGSHYRNPVNGDFVARIFVGGCPPTLLHRSSIVYENIYGESGVIGIGFTLFSSCSLRETTARISVESCTAIVTETCMAVPSSISKTVRVE